MPEPIEQICALLTSARKIFIAAHTAPDGDGLGSTLALMWGLRKIGKTVNATCDDRLPETYSYLAGFQELAPRVPADEDVLVYLDGSDCTRYGRAFDLALINNRPTICIDHHVTNDHFARINWVDTRAAAVAELIFELLARLQIQVATQAVIASEAKQSPPSHAEIASSQKTLLAMTGAEQLLDENIAQCLLTGIVTDTLVFRTTSTTALTLEIAAQLIRAGGSIVEIVDHAYMRRSLKSLRLFGRVMSTAQIEDAIIWGEVSYATIRELGLNKNGTSGLVNQLLTVAEANIAFLLVEQENGKIDLNLRARPGLDISAVALALGGGGHPQAAGAMLEGPLDAARTRVLNEIKRSLGRQYA